MVIGQVGKDGHIKVHRIHPSHGKAVGADLHGYSLHAVLHHFTQILMDLDGVRRGQARNFAHAAVADGDGSHIAAGRLLFVDVPDDAGRSGLSIGAGNAEYGHLPAGLSVEQVADPVQLTIHVFRSDIGHARQPIQIVRVDHGTGPRLAGFVRETVAVSLQTLQAEEQIAFLRLPGVDAQSLYFHCRRSCKQF